MILHTHQVDDNGEVVEVYVLHATPAESKLLADALFKALGDQPDVESYSITLGRAQDLSPKHVPEIVEPGPFKNGTLATPPNGLIVP